MSYSLTDPDRVTRIEVTMPETGAGDAVRVVAWHRHAGESVTVDEPLCVVAIGGGNAEIDSPASGVMRTVVVAPGQEAAPGVTLALIDVAVAEPEVEPQVELPPPPEPEPEPEPDRVPIELVRDAPVEPADPVELSGFLSPAVRRFAREHDLDPLELAGSGRDGRVTLADVRGAHESSASKG